MTVLVLALALAGCGQDMTDQEKLLPDRASEVFADGKVDQHPPAGTIARDDAMSQQRPPLTRALMERGRERYQIDCAPCHSPAGDGDGLIPRHGFPHPPSYTDQQVRELDDASVVQVVTNGYGVMAGYGDRVAPNDRWAIVAWVRVLQLSQAAPVASLPPEWRAQIEEGR